MSVKSLTTSSLLSAIVFISMLLINISMFNSTLHIGSLVIVIICLVFERRQAVLATCVGSIFYDLAGGLAIYLPFTIVARFLMAYIISFAKDKSYFNQVICTILGSVVVVFVYFIAFVIFLDDYTLAFYASSADTIQIIFNVMAVFVAIQVKKLLKDTNLIS